MSLLITSSACCCDDSPCALRSAVTTDILLTPLGAYTAGFTGNCSLFVVQTPHEEVTFFCPSQLGAGCHIPDCCALCSGTQCWQCEPPWTESNQLCMTEVESTPVAGRVFPNGVGGAWCTACESPSPPCATCTGFGSTGFLNSGFDSTAFVVVGLASGCATGGAGTTTVTIASKTVVQTSGTSTLTTRKMLRMHTWETTVGGVQTCHLALQLDLHLVGSAPFSCGVGTDGFTQTLTYWSVWNGSDTAAQFLGRSMNCVWVIWDYNLCQFSYVGGNKWHCSGTDISTFVPTTCGWCTCQGYSVDYVEVLFTPTMSLHSANCAIAMSPDIDLSFQPWLGAPATIVLI